MNQNWKLLDLTNPKLKKIADDLANNREDLAKIDLANYFANRRQPGFLKDARKTVDLIKQEQSTDFKANADRLTEHTFLFNKPWDMEKCFTPVQLAPQIDWHHTYNDDPEWMWMLNRHNYLLDLIIQYLLTQDPHYLDTYVDLMTQWMTSEDSGNGREDTSWRTLDTGIRLKNWVKQLEFIMPANVLSGDFYLALFGSIQKQCDYQIEHYTDSEALSNWRILQYHGVSIIATFFPELVDAKKWRQIAQERLEYCLNIQVTNDGFHWEQSMMYHHEVLLNALEAQQVAKNNRLTFADPFLKQLKKMLKASQDATMPNYQQPCYGDSDVEDLRNIQTLAALVLDDSQVNPFSILKEANLSLLLDYGVEANRDLKALRQQLATDFSLDAVHEDVGNYFVRTGYTTDSSYLFFKNGFLGGGHGHNDLLHFDLFLNGDRVLVDSGRYTYKANSSERPFFKSAAQHNTLLLDHHETTIQDGAWGNQFVTQEIKQPATVNQPYVLLQGTHLGYAPEAIVSRKLIMIKELNLVIVADEILTNGSHHYDQHFHFAPEGKASISHDSVSFSGTTRTVNFYPLTQQSLAIKDVKISPHYNELVAAQECIMSADHEGNAVLLTLIADETEHSVKCQQVPITQIAGAPVDNHKNSALKITQNGEEFLVVINHFEGQGDSRKIFVVEGTSMFGRVIVAKKINNKFVPQVLAY